MTDKSNSRVVILQSMTLNANSINFLQGKINCTRDDLIRDDDKENDPVMYHKNRRRTASSYIFDEEPIFSDSDEEKEYCKNILATHKCFVEKYETSETECSLSVNDLKIINVIKECADISIESVKDDFKQLVKICKDLRDKYKHVGSIHAEIVTTHNEVPNKEAFSNTNLNNNWLVPSRSGNSSEGDDFFSQTFSFDSGFETHEPVNGHKRICMTNEKRKSLNNRQSQVKKENVRINKKNSREIKDIRKQTKTVTAVTVQKHANGKQNTKLKRANIKNPWYVFYWKARPLPREQVRVLARTWMKPNKSILNKLSSKSKSVQQKSKSRKLFSANKWQQTPEFLSQRIE